MRVFKVKLTIAKKIFLGYLLMTAVTAAVGAVAVVSLGILNQLSSKIVTQDFSTQVNTQGMIDTLLAQELYERRYIVLGIRANKALFLERDKEFLEYLAAFQKIPSLGPTEGKKIETLHQEYLDLFNQAATLMGRGSVDSAIALSRGMLGKKREELIAQLKGIQQQTIESQKLGIVQSNKIGKIAFFFALFLSILSFAIGILLTFLLTRNIAGPIKELMDAASRIGRGQFDAIPKIQQGDEVGELAKAFQNMSLHLKELEAMQLDANPLTKMPGSLAIEKYMEGLIEREEKFAFGLVDLDHFKAFNDRYGYARGNEVILKLSSILQEALEPLKENSFIGHVGGDDFVVIASPDKIRDICEKVIESFDKEITGFYDKKDLDKGYIVSRNRQNLTQNFSIMTISIAVVTNEKRSYNSTIKVSEVASELKGYAKSIPKSVYVIDKRVEL